MKTMMFLKIADIRSQRYSPGPRRVGRQLPYRKTAECGKATVEARVLSLTAAYLFMVFLVGGTMVGGSKFIVWLDSDLVGGNCLVGGSCLVGCFSFVVFIFFSDGNFLVGSFFWLVPSLLVVLVWLLFFWFMVFFVLC